MVFGFFEVFFLFVWFFFGLFGISFKVTMVTTKFYQGYYWTPQIAKNGPKKVLAEGRSTSQELEVGPNSGPYLLVLKKNVLEYIFIYRFNVCEKFSSEKQ